MAFKESKKQEIQRMNIEFKNKAPEIKQKSDQSYDQLPNIEDTRVEKWTFVEGFPEYGREHSTCYIDNSGEHNDIVVIGGNM